MSSPQSRPILHHHRISVGAALLAVSLLIAACSGGSSAPSTSATAPGFASASAERDVVNGAAARTTTITVRFDAAFDLVQSRASLASHFEVYVASFTSDTLTRVIPRTAERSASNPRLITLKVDTLVPEGSRLKVSRSAFASGGTGAIEAEIESSLTDAQAFLAVTPFGLASADLLQPGQSRPATPADNDDAAVRTLLQDHLTARGARTDTANRVLQAYDTMSREIVPAPKLRAALAALTGTFAEPAIESLLTTGNCTGKPAARIAFQPPPEFPDLLARVTFAPDGARIVSVNPLVAGDRFELFMPLLAHEAIHCDQQAGVFEEVAATAIDTFLYLHLIYALPDLPYSGGLLARDFNIDAIAMLNSGRRLPESAGILPSGFPQAVPRTNTTYTSFAEVVAAAYSVGYEESPAEPLMQSYVTLLAQSAGMAVRNGFDLVYLDELIGRAIDPLVLIGAMEALGLEPA